MCHDFFMMMLQHNYCCNRAFGAAREFPRTLLEFSCAMRLIIALISVFSAACASSKTHLRKQDVVFDPSITSPGENYRGMGYYNTAFYSSSTCAGTPIFVEGYATGRCLVLANGGSVRFDCIGSSYAGTCALNF